MKLPLLALLAATACLANAASVPKYTYDLPASISAADAPRFDGHKVVRITNPSAELLARVSTDGLDVWGRGLNSIDIRVAREADAVRLGNYRVVVPDVQKYLDAEFAKLQAAERTPSFSANGPADGNEYFKSYHKYAEILDFLKGHCDAVPDVCTFTPSIGKTVEGRDIAAFQIGTKAANKPQIYMQGSQHAREWAASSTVQYIAWQLLSKASSDATVKDLLSKLDFHIIVRFVSFHVLLAGQSDLFRLP